MSLGPTTAPRGVVAATTTHTVVACLAACSGPTPTAQNDTIPPAPSPRRRGSNSPGPESL
jgi:hypothetical protein